MIFKRAESPLVGIYTEEDILPAVVVFPCNDAGVFSCFSVPGQTKYSLEPAPECTACAWKCSVNSQARRAMLPAQAKSTFVFPGNLPLAYVFEQGEKEYQGLP